MKKMLEAFIAKAEVSSEVINELKKGVKSISVKKGTIIQREGDPSLYSFLVLKGLLKSYTIDNKGKEHIFMFASENWVISDIDVYSENCTSQLFIEAIEDSEIERVNNGIFKLLKHFPQTVLFNEIERLLKRTSVLQRRILMLMSSSAKERYNEFLITYPELVQRIPQKLIASYLGITPEALSKIKAEIVRS